ncbi:hypothetical protein GJ629_15220 [Halapricum sp. CBA1109]|uniref:hypothetical protein n=1 Tax=Halapricum sp. CBA1109 TaxID=2668068 RepID=UPI0012F7662C|nr:hypothetical protein [Halapricum sp. CBA1109]MUV91070.1 hypothetical protein [Halapricum sp. CBA1109]
MTDSGDPLAEKHERNRQQRIAEIERWVEYIQTNPPDVWGEQLNTLIESQIETARESGVSAAQRERVRKASEALSERE